jgi:hypothetical protein
VERSSDRAIRIRGSLCYPYFHSVLPVAAALRP